MCNYFTHHNERQQCIEEAGWGEDQKNKNLTSCARTEQMKGARAKALFNGVFIVCLKAHDDKGNTRAGRRVPVSCVSVCPKIGEFGILHNDPFGDKKVQFQKNAKKCSAPRVRSNIQVQIPRDA